MQDFIRRVSEFVRHRVEMRDKMDEPTLKKYRIFTLHVRTVAEIIGVVGFLIFASLTSAEFSRHRWIAGLVGFISAACHALLILGINWNYAWAHWPYFFVYPIALLLQILLLISSHVEATPHEHDQESMDDHGMNLITLILFIGFILLVNGGAIYVVQRAYMFMLDYLRKKEQIEYHGEEMMDVVIRTPEDAEEVEGKSGH
ncbi:hypothetical protein M3Y99_00473800 [Aphelenchoides fujianensis]|nr:hypothetical protein M3Y99_00473800 [Aphelenchoides fujianensis]